MSERKIQFKYDAFLSHSAKDKEVVRDIANRLKSDGVRVWPGNVTGEWEGVSGSGIPAKIEDGLEHSRVLVLCLSQAALAADWPQLESHTFRFKDPLNHNRRFIPLRLDDTPTKGSLAQFSYIDWRPEQRENEYPKLVEACRHKIASLKTETGSTRIHSAKWIGRIDDPTLDELNESPGGKIWGYAFGLNAKRAIICGVGSPIRLWDVDTDTRLSVLDGHSEAVRRVIWSPQENQLLSASHDHTLRLWDTDTGECLRVFEGHTSRVLAASFSDDRRTLLSGACDNTLRLWDVASGACLHVFEGHSNYVIDVTWSPSQHFALSGSSDETVRVWNLRTRTCERVLEGHTRDVNCVAWSNDQLAISGSEDGTLRIWDMRTGRCQRVLSGHTNGVGCVAFHSREHLVVSGSDDMHIRLWNVETGRCVCVLEGHSETIKHVEWSTNGRQVFSGDGNGGIRVWDLSEFVTDAPPRVPSTSVSLAPEQVQYTNAKVLLVGNSAAGKTGLSNRLALDTYKETDSTVGAWATQWKLPLPDVAGASSRSAEQEEPEEQRQDAPATNVEREVWLWDFGGQADQRLIHQLYMDQTQVAALVFDPHKGRCLRNTGAVGPRPQPGRQRHTRPRPHDEAAGRRSLRYRRAARGSPADRRLCGRTRLCGVPRNQREDPRRLCEIEAGDHRRHPVGKHPVAQLAGAVQTAER